MAYRHFDFKQVLRQFKLENRVAPLLEQVVSSPFPENFRSTLEEGIGLGLRGGSEKARSEFIVAPILLATRLLLERRITVHSGLHFDVDKAQGLVGECDFLISSGDNLPMLVNTAVLSVVEAKKQDIEAGLGQCVAQMVAAQQHNNQLEQSVVCVYGCVTTAESWQFLKLEGQHLTFDANRYQIAPSSFETDVSRLLGAFQALLEPLVSVLLEPLV
jgi:hypothetical protein